MNSYRFGLHFPQWNIYCIFDEDITNLSYKIEWNIYAHCSKRLEIKIDKKRSKCKLFITDSFMNVSCAFLKTFHHFIPQIPFKNRCMLTMQFVCKWWSEQLIQQLDFDISGGCAHPCCMYFVDLIRGQKATSEASLHLQTQLHFSKILNLLSTIFVISFAFKFCWSTSNSIQEYNPCYV